MSLCPGRLEVLIVDDHSRRDSRDQLTKLVAGAEGFRLLDNRGSPGVGAARNVGIENSCGRYIYFADSDDAIHAEPFVEFTQSTLEGLPPYDIIFANHIKAATNENVTWPSVDARAQPIIALDPAQIRDLVTQFCRHPRVYSIWPHCWNKFFRKDFLHARQLRFSEHYNQLEDVEFVARCCLAAENAAQSEASLYAHALQGGGRLSTSFFFPDDLVAFTERALQPLADLLERFGVDAKESYALYRQCVGAHVATYTARALNALLVDFQPARLVLLTQALRNQHIGRAVCSYEARADEDPHLGPLLKRGLPGPLLYVYWRYARGRRGKQATLPPPSARRPGSGRTSLPGPHVSVTMRWEREGPAIFAQASSAVHRKLPGGPIDCQPLPGCENQRP